MLMTPHCLCGFFWFLDRFYPKLCCSIFSMKHFIHLPHKESYLLMIRMSGSIFFLYSTTPLHIHVAALFHDWNHKFPTSTWSSHHKFTFFIKFTQVRRGGLKMDNHFFTCFYKFSPCFLAWLVKTWLLIIPN